MKIGDSKVIDFNDINKRNILIVIILMIFFIGTTMIYNYGYDKGYKEGTTKTTTTTDSYTSPSLTTEITAANKTNTSDPDLILNNRYHAVINGTDIQIPVKDKYIKETLKDTPSSPSSSTTSTTSTTARVDQTLDLTPIFKDYEKKHKWEVGTGIGRVSNEWYVPIEVQRNFGYNKGVSFQLNVKDNKVDGFQASYKIRF